MKADTATAVVNARLPHVFVGYGVYFTDDSKLMSWVQTMTSTSDSEPRQNVPSSASITITVPLATS